MKLVCPSCAAEYKVPAAQVGGSGRMVRCSSCGAEWFQAAGRDDEPVVEAGVADAGPVVDGPVVDDPVIAIPEVEDTGPELGYRIQPAETNSAKEEIYFDPEPEPETGAVDETLVRRRRDEERDELAASLADINHAAPRQSGGAFLAGFSTVAVLAVIALGVYVKAGDIATLAPAAEPVLKTYTGLVDQGRVAIAGLIG